MTSATASSGTAPWSKINDPPECVTMRMFQYTGMCRIQLPKRKMSNFLLFHAASKLRNCLIKS